MNRGTLPVVLMVMARVGSGSALLTLRVSGTDVTWEYEAFGSQGLAVPSVDVEFTR